jgi:hypothetical protein
VGDHSRRHWQNYDREGRFHLDRKGGLYYGPGSQANHVRGREEQHIPVSVATSSNEHRYSMLGIISCF